MSSASTNSTTTTPSSPESGVNPTSRLLISPGLRLTTTPSRINGFHPSGPETWRMWEISEFPVFSKSMYSVVGYPSCPVGWFVRDQLTLATDSTSREIESLTSTPSPCITRVTMGSEDASAERGITTVHQTVDEAPAASEEGAEQDDDQSSSGTSRLVVGRQVVEPWLVTIQARSKPGSPTGWAPTPSGWSATVPSGRATMWKSRVGIAPERTFRVLFQST